MIRENAGFGRGEVHARSLAADFLEQPPHPVRPAILVSLALSSSLLVHGACGSTFRSSAVATSLTDDEFRGLSTRLSEPAGTFTHSDNLVSNEGGFVYTARLLRPGGGVYIGVGPEQNFSYIARLRPSMAFVVDIRRENLDLHLMYKALFELSRDRAEFMSRLFSRERPAGLDSTSSVEDLFASYAAVEGDPALRDANAGAIRERLMETHTIPLSADDLAWIDYALDAFSRDGPEIQYGRLRPKDAPGPSYRALMTAADTRGVHRSYLAGEEAFAFVKDLHARNLIVPVVGDFSGSHAIRQAADYIRSRHGTVSAFYASNVEVYLNREQIAAFCANLAALPHDARTWFIGNKGMQPLRSKLRSCAARASSPLP